MSSPEHGRRLLDDARRVLLAELERVRFDHCQLPPIVLTRAVALIAVGARTVAHTVEFFQAGERCKAALARGELDYPMAVRMMQQLRERHLGARQGD